MLQRSSCTFSEEDMRECDLNLMEVAVFSGLCTELPSVSSSGRRTFCYVHFTVQVNKQAKRHTALGQLEESQYVWRNVFQTFRFKCPLCVFSLEGVHGCFVRLHGVSFRVQECSGLWLVAHAQHFHHQTRSDQIGSKPGPQSGGADPSRPFGMLWHVPTLSVRLACPRLPWRAARGASLPPQCCKGQWAGWGAAATAAGVNGCTTEQSRSGGELKGMLTRNGAGTEVNCLMNVDRTDGQSLFWKWPQNNLFLTFVSRF